MNHSFVDLILSALKEHDNGNIKNETTESLVKLLIELRESARKNHDFETFEKITSEMENFGIKLREETHIVASLSTDSRP